jgi:hypothetical protein
VSLYSQIAIPGQTCFPAATFGIGRTFAAAAAAADRESNPIHPILQMLSQDLITTLIGHRKQAGIFQPLSGARSIRSSNKLAAFTKSKILHSWV